MSLSRQKQDPVAPDCHCNDADFCVLEDEADSGKPRCLRQYHQGHSVDIFDWLQRVTMSISSATRNASLATRAHQPRGCGRQSTRRTALPRFPSSTLLGPRTRADQASLRSAAALSSAALACQPSPAAQLRALAAWPGRGMRARKSVWRSAYSTGSSRVSILRSW